MGIKSCGSGNFCLCDRTPREQHKSHLPHPQQEKCIPWGEYLFFPIAFLSLLLFIWVGGFIWVFLILSMPTKAVSFSCPSSQARPLSPLRDLPFQVQHPGMGTVQQFSYKLLHSTLGWGCSYLSQGYFWEKERRVRETTLSGKFCGWVRRFPEVGARLRCDPKSLQQQPGISQSSHSSVMERGHRNMEWVGVEGP